MREIIIHLLFVSIVYTKTLSMDDTYQMNERISQLYNEWVKINQAEMKYPEHMRLRMVRQLVEKANMLVQKCEEKNVKDTDSEVFITFFGDNGKSAIDNSLGVTGCMYVGVSNDFNKCFKIFMDYVGHSKNNYGCAFQRCQSKSKNTCIFHILPQKPMGEWNLQSSSHTKVPPLGSSSPYTTSNPLQNVPCGKSSSTALKQAGIKAVQRNNVPWKAGVMEGSGNGLNQYGSAVILSEKWILTAAHCLIDGKTLKAKDPNNLRVIVGHNTFKDRNQSKIHLVERIFVPATYNTLNTMNDVGLIKLSPMAPGYIKFNSDSQPACLPRQENINEIDNQVCRLCRESEDINDWSLVAKDGVAHTAQRHPNGAFMVGEKLTQLFVSGDSGGGVICNVNGRDTVYGIVSITTFVEKYINDYATDVGRSISWIYEIIKKYN